MTTEKIKIATKSQESICSVKIHDCGNGEILDGCFKGETLTPYQLKNGGCNLTKITFQTDGNSLMKLTVLQGKSDSDCFRLPEPILGYSWWLCGPSLLGSPQTIEVDNVLKNGERKTRVANCHPAIKAGPELSEALAVPVGSIVCGVRYWS